MEHLPENEILEFIPDTLQAVRKMYNLDKPGEMADAVNIFDAWVKQQGHFVKKDFNRDYLERIIISSKGSIEKAKTRLDKLCTMRTFLPQFFEERDVKKDFACLDEHGIMYVPLPRLSKNYERIFFYKCSSKNLTTADLLSGFKLCAMIAEYLKTHDYAASYRFVCDIRECNLGDLMLKIGLMDVRNIMSILTEGYGVRLTGIHLLTSNKLVDGLIGLLKQVLSEKISSRISVHRTVETLYEIAPKEVLPKEYGGEEERSVEQLRDMWLNALDSETFRQYYRKMKTAGTDEEFRQSDNFNDKYMGMPGTFRTLTVD